MKPNAAIAFATCIWSLLATVPGGACRAGETAGEINAADLRTGRATIVGYLGHPLGEVVTIRGTWRAAPKLAKSSDPIFEVTHIDGEAIAPPLELTRFRVRAVHDGGRSRRNDKEVWDWKAAFYGKTPAPDFKPGETWELAGAETFSTRIPVAVWDEHERVVAVNPDFGANGFLATFDFIRARRIATEPAETSK